MVNVDLVFLTKNFFHKSLKVIVDLEPACLVEQLLVFGFFFEMRYVHFGSMGNSAVFLCSC